MDLTPRDATGDSTGDAARGANASMSTGRNGRRRWLSMAILVATIVFGGVVVTKFLSSAIDYYCNVDEVGNRSGCEADRRLRVQGTVDQGSIKQAAGTTTFKMTFNAKTLDVRYDGDPGGVFQECIPVVAHGRLVNGVFLSDRIEVKHSNNYVAKNKDRMNKAEAAADACSRETEQDG